MKIKPAEMSRKWRDSNDALECPACGCNCMTHDRVTVFSRKEDAEETRVTRVEGDQISSVVRMSQLADNPSSRRHGLAIRFWCEACPAPVELTIEQHKGETFIGWRSTDER